MWMGSTNKALVTQLANNYAGSMGLPIRKENGYVMEKWDEPREAVGGLWVIQKPDIQAANATGKALDTILIKNPLLNEYETVEFPQDQV